MIRVFRLPAVLVVMSSVTAGVCLADGSAMAKEMKEVGKSVKALRMVAKGDYAAGAAAVRKAHEALLRAMGHTASMVQEMPDGVEKDKALADSRRLLGENYTALCELELAYLEKNDAKIAAAMEKIKQSKGEGHKKYTDD